MGNGGATLLPAPDDRLVKSIKILELSNTDLSKVRTVLLYTAVVNTCLKKSTCDPTTTILTTISHLAHTAR